MPLLLLLLLGSCSSASPEVARTPDPRDQHQRSSLPLSFSIREGVIDNHFYRDSHVGAHLVLRSGPRPRLIVAFPEGNAGTAVWFETHNAQTTFRLQRGLKRVDGPNKLRGVTAELSINNPTPAKKVILGSIRVLRDYEHKKSHDRVHDPELHRQGATWSWSRQTLDGHRLLLKVEFIQGGFDGATARFRLTAMHDYPAMHPIEATDVFRPSARRQIAKTPQQVFTYLSYHEKLLAGSWRFLTYFGRDTLLSLALMHDALTPVVLEAGLGSVLERINDQGQVAHEEEIGEFPALFSQAKPAKEVRPRYDYTMLDDDLLLPIVAHRIFFHQPGFDRKYWERFVQRDVRPGTTYAMQLERNIRHVLKTALPYAQTPSKDHLIRIQSAKGLGQWRDSKEGLGYAAIPYDVNAVLMPSALRAIPDLVRVLGLDVTLQKQAKSMLPAWSKAHRHFKVELTATAANHLALQHATSRKMPLASSAGLDKLTFYALALESSGAPLGVMHSDVAFDLFFSMPRQAELDLVLGTLERPFPWGLYTPIGIMVANAAFEDDQWIRGLFTPHHYHGEVFWPWQHAMITAGLANQLQRRDLERHQRKRLLELCTRMQSQVLPKGSSTELSTWDYDQHRGYRPQAFQRQGDVTESNAAQLWSVATEANRHRCPMN